MNPTNDSGANISPKRRRRQNSTQTAAEQRAALNRPEALKMRIAGLSYRQIGEKPGVSCSTAFEYVSELLAANQEANEQKLAGANGAPLVPALSPEVNAALLAGYQQIAANPHPVAP